MISEMKMDSDFLKTLECKCGSKSLAVLVFSFDDEGSCEYLDDGVFRQWTDWWEINTAFKEPKDWFWYNLNQSGSSPVCQLSDEEKEEISERVDLEKDKTYFYMGALCNECELEEPISEELQEKIEVLFNLWNDKYRED